MHIIRETSDIFVVVLVEVVLVLMVVVVVVVIVYIARGSITDPNAMFVLK
jgi:hypothetical protein